MDNWSKERLIEDLKEALIDKVLLDNTFSVIYSELTVCYSEKEIQEIEEEALNRTKEEYKERFKEELLWRY